MSGALCNGAGHMGRLAGRLARLEAASATMMNAPHDWRADLQARLEELHQRMVAAGAEPDALSPEEIKRAVQARLDAAGRRAGEAGRTRKEP